LAKLTAFIFLAIQSAFFGKNDQKRQKRQCYLPAARTKNNFTGREESAR
jgi:hypothetical protein